MRVIGIIATALAVGFATAFAALLGMSGLVMLTAFLLDFEAGGAAVGAVALVSAAAIGLWASFIIAVVMGDDR